jgi:hypothetical protein
MLNKLLLTLSYINYISAHSWIECVDYQIADNKDKEYYNKDNCIGFPRGFDAQYNAGFGIDTGFNLLKTDSCQSSDKNSYNGVIVKASYVAGQQVCLAYPAKGHVAAKCGTSNEFIPDAGTTIRRSKIPDSDSFNDTVNYQHLNGVHVKGVVDYKGYQNCPKFCEDTDKALCTICFNLNKDEPSGSFSFQWMWEFNPNEFYHTCWDAEIVGTNSQPSMNPSPSPVPTTKCPNEPTISPTPEPTKHEDEECPGFPGMFVSSLNHCPSPSPPTEEPTNPPSEEPTEEPTDCPEEPSPVPTPSPTIPAPTEVPTPSPTIHEDECPGFPGLFVSSLNHCPSSAPPTEEPTMSPSPVPTQDPTMSPTPEPTTECPELPLPTEGPTMSPTPEPTTAPTEDPSNPPTEDPSNPPTEDPSNPPTEDPELQECPGFPDLLTKDLTKCPPENCIFI